MEGGGQGDWGPSMRGRAGDRGPSMEGGGPGDWGHSVGRAGGQEPSMGRAGGQGTLYGGGQCRRDRDGGTGDKVFCPLHSGPLSPHGGSPLTLLCPLSMVLCLPILPLSQGPLSLLLCPSQGPLFPLLSPPGLPSPWMVPFLSCHVFCGPALATHSQASDGPALWPLVSISPASRLCAPTLCT